MIEHPTKWIRLVPVEGGVRAICLSCQGHAGDDVPALRADRGTFVLELDEAKS